MSASIVTICQKVENLGTLGIVRAALLAALGEGALLAIHAVTGFALPYPSVLVQFALFTLYELEYTPERDPAVFGSVAVTATLITMLLNDMVTYWV